MKCRLLFSVETVGDSGDAYLIKGAVFTHPDDDLFNAYLLKEFTLYCPIESCIGNENVKTWLMQNTPIEKVTHRSPDEIAQAFSQEYHKLLDQFDEIDLISLSDWPYDVEFLTRAAVPTSNLVFPEVSCHPQTSL